MEQSLFLQRTKKQYQKRKYHRTYQCRKFSTSSDHQELSITPKIINLSDHQLKDEERTVLLKGMKFCPTPVTFNSIENQSDRSDYIRRLRLTEFFHEIEDNDKSLVKPKSNFNPPDGRNESLDDVITLLRNNQQPVKKTNIFNNMLKIERHAMAELGKNKNLVIKEADKGSAVIIMHAD